MAALFDSTHSMKKILRTTLVLTIFGAASSLLNAADNAHRPSPVEGPEQPNILWIYVEDTNDWMSCYGETLIETPNIDKLAASGTRFTRAYMTSGVCSPTRSAIITGRYQTSIGAHEHYSSFSRFRGNDMEVWEPNHLGVKTLPEIFKAAGYYTFNEGKYHYNFVFDPDTLYDRHSKLNGFQGATNGSEWTGRDPGQPFFGQIQLVGGKYKNPEAIVQPEEVTVHPYYPDHPIIRAQTANHYNTILELDKAVGKIIAALKRDGVYENTVVFFFSDHGCDLPRHKQFLYDESIQVPFIMAGPQVARGQVRDDLVSSLDISATSLELAQIPTPDTMHGMNLLAEDFHRDYVVAARDRCDFTIDRIRAVTSKRYKYIRNFMTDRPYLQPNYRSDWPEMRILKELYEAGELNEVQAHFVREERPAEEFYDLQEDPHETNNLVHSVKREHAVALAEHRDVLYRWILETNDQGRFPETKDSLRAVVDRWGDDAVNPEYDEVRNE